MSNTVYDTESSTKYKFLLVGNEIKLEDSFGARFKVDKVRIKELCDEWEVHEKVAAENIVTIRDHLKSQKSPTPKREKELNKWSLAEHYRQCYFFMTKNQGDGYLIDREGYKHVTLDKSAITSVIDEEDPFWSEKFFVGKKVYDPYNNKLLFDAHDGKLAYKAMNTYSIPSWKIKEPKKVDMHPVLDKFFSTLFPRPECKEYVLDWCATSMRKKNHCYLVLIGEKGVGKGIFVSLMAGLHGRENFELKSSEQAYDFYDGGLAEKTLVNFDEITVMCQTQYNYLKTFVNDYKTYRPMHGESFTAKNFANLIITLNPESIISALDTNDRRFAIPMLNNTKLLNTLTAKEVDMLANDEELLENFVASMYHREVVGTMTDRYVNQDKLHEISSLAMPSYMQEFFDLVRQALLDEVDYKLGDDPNKYLDVYIYHKDKFRLKKPTDAHGEPARYVITWETISSALNQAYKSKNPDIAKITNYKIRKFLTEHKDCGKICGYAGNKNFDIATNKDLLALDVEDQVD